MVRFLAFTPLKQLPKPKSSVLAVKNELITWHVKSQTQ